MDRHVPISETLRFRFGWYMHLHASADLD